MEQIVQLHVSYNTYRATVFEIEPAPTLSTGIVIHVGRISIPEGANLQIGGNSVPISITLADKRTGKIVILDRTDNDAIFAGIFSSAASRGVFS